MSQPAIRVMSVEDHELVVEGLKTLIDAEPDMELVGRMSSAEGIVEEARRLAPDIAILDVEMPGPDIFEAMENLRRQCPDVRVVMLSAFMRDRYIDSAHRAGAWGFFSKDDEPSMLIEGVRKVARGEMAFPGDVLQRIIAGRQAGEKGGSVSKLDRLTPRERQILRMIGKGMSRIEIAEEISRSPMTVDNHRKSIMKKLEIHDRVELALYAVSEKLAEI